MALYNILVVDDEVNNLRALRRTLRHEYSVLTATNGEDALAIMEQKDIAVIIADYRLSGMTGIQLLEKTLRKYPKTVRIILTAYTEEKLLIDAINKVHAHGYLAKPWEPDEIKFIVRKCLKDQQRLLGDGRPGLSFWKQRVFGQEQPVSKTKDEDKVKEQLTDGVHRCWWFRRR